MFRILNFVILFCAGANCFGQVLGFEPPKYVSQEVEAHWECIDNGEQQCRIVCGGADCAEALAAADSALNSCSYSCEEGGMAEKVFSVCDDDDEGEGEISGPMFLGAPVHRPSCWTLKIRYRFGNGEFISVRSSSSCYCRAVQKAWKTAVALGRFKCGVCCGMQKCTIECRPSCGCCVNSCGASACHSNSCYSRKRTRRQRRCR